MDKLKEKLSRFMYGRYGSDRLNIFMVIVLLVCAVINLFVRTGYFSVLLTSWEFLLLILIYYRMFSKNISKRYAENQKYLELENKGAGFEELELLTLGGLRKAVVEGDVKNGSVMAGQIAGMVKERMSCKELIDKLVSETDALIKGAGFYE